MICVADFLHILIDRIGMMEVEVLPYLGSSDYHLGNLKTFLLLFKAQEIQEILGPSLEKYTPVPMPLFVKTIMKIHKATL